jgi:hypothetical protein
MKIIETIKNFKELIASLLFLAAVSLAAYSHFAPATRVDKLECALESQRILAIELDKQNSNFRNRIAAQDNERLLTDLLILIMKERDDSPALKSFSSDLIEHIKPKIEVTRSTINNLEIEAASINAQVTNYQNKVTKKECPND